MESRPHEFKSTSQSKRHEGLNTLDLHDIGGYSTEQDTSAAHRQGGYSTQRSNEADFQMSLRKILNDNPN